MALDKIFITVPSTDEIMDDLIGTKRKCEKCKKDFRNHKAIPYCYDCGCPECFTGYRIGIWNFPCNGSGDHALGAFYKGDHLIHTSERVALSRNPHTGETRPLGRNDVDIHPKYKAAGFTERVLLETHQQIRALEKEKGWIHEASNYTNNSSQATKDTGAKE